MRTLRELSEPLVAAPLAPRLPVDELRSRARRRARVRAGIAATALLTALAVLAGGIAGLGGDSGSDARVVTQGRESRSPTVSQVQVGGALAVAVGEGSVWVPAFDVVRRIDPERNGVIAEVAVPGESEHRSVTVGLGSVWVTNPATGSLARIDPATNTGSEVLRGEVSGQAPVAVTTDRVWVSHQRGGITPLDPLDNSLGAPVSLGLTGLTDMIGIGDVVYAISGEALVRYDTMSGTLRSRRIAGGVLDLAPLGDDLVVITTAGRAVRLDGTTLRVVERSAPIPHATHVVAAQDLFVLSQPDSRRPSELRRLDARTFEPVGKTIQTGETSVGLAASSWAVWVANYGGSGSNDGRGATLTRIDLVGSRPRPDLCWQPELGTADGLPPLSDAPTDSTAVAAAASAGEAHIRSVLPNVIDVSWGPGRGRAWVQDANGRVTTWVVDDFAVIVTVGSRRDCIDASEASVIAVEIGAPVLVAFEPGRRR